MKLEKISIDNFRCFEHLDIEFTQVDELSTSLFKSAGTTVFIGNAGSGKTAVLESIVYLLNTFTTSFPLNKTKQIKDTDFCNFSNVSYLYLSAQTSDGTQWSITKNRDSSIKTPKQIDNESTKNKVYEIIDCFNSGTQKELFPIFCYYASNRSVTYKVPEGLQNLYYYDAYRGALTGNFNYKKMISWIQYLSAKQLRGIQAAKMYYTTLEQKAMQLAIERILPGFHNLKLRTKPLDLEIDIKDKTYRIASQLSDSYKTLLFMVLDITSRILMLNADVPGFTHEDMLGSPGIVLIDEVELHLDPTQQKSIMTDLQQTFPNIQFIATTNSPQVISSLPPEIVKII